MLRYSLGTLFLLMLYLAVGCAALVNVSGIWPQVVVTLSLAVLVLYSLAAMFWQNEWRVFGIGFSITGWLYFVLAFTNLTSVRPYLLTESAINQLFVTMHGNQSGQFRLVAQTRAGPNGPVTLQSFVYSSPVLPGPTPTAPPGGVTPPVFTGTVMLAPTVGQPAADSTSFASIGHALCAVIIGLIGGIIAQIFHRRTHSKRDQSDQFSS